MSGTRSPSPKAPATECAAILVGHGQPSDPLVAERELSTLRSEVARKLPSWSVHSATLAAPGCLDRSLEKAGTSPLIYPLFMTDGWFTKTELPRRLSGASARVLPPLGSEDGLIDLAIAQLTSVLTARSWTTSETQLVVAAHGSGRSTVPAENTRRFAKKLAAAMGFRRHATGFLEETPKLADVLADAGPKTLCLPFFASRRDHVLEDLPDACREARFKGVCLDPIGTLPGVSDLIAARLKAARKLVTAA